MSTNLKVKPLSDRVLVKREEQTQKTAGGIFLPETAKEEPQFGRVVRTGPGKYEDGKTRPLFIKEGDKVIFGKYSGTKVKVGEDELLFMREEDIMAVVED